MAAEKSQQEGSSRESSANVYPQNWLVPWLLLLLRNWSSYGYDLMERLTELGFATMNPGTFYRALRQLEKDGMVSSMWDTSKSGPARRVYALTEAGEAYLKFWASSFEQYQKLTDTFFRIYLGQMGLGPQDDKKHP
jgi:PadR family transcriptional regulator